MSLIVALVEYKYLEKDNCVKKMAACHMIRVYQIFNASKEVGLSLDTWPSSCLRVYWRTSQC